MARSDAISQVSAPFFSEKKEIYPLKKPFGLFLVLFLDAQTSLRITVSKYPARYTDLSVTKMRQKQVKIQILSENQTGRRYCLLRTQAL